MHEVITRTFDKEDVELIKRYLPDSPCKSCDAGIGCCGCPEQRDYEATYVKPLKDAGVYEYAVQYNRYLDSFRKHKWEIQAELETLQFLGDELGDMAPQVLTEAIEESIRSTTNLLEKYQMFKKQLGTSVEVLGSSEVDTKETDTINVF